MHFYPFKVEHLCVCELNLQTEQTRYIRNVFIFLLRLMGRISGEPARLQLASLDVSSLGETENHQTNEGPPFWPGKLWPRAPPGKKGEKKAKLKVSWPALSPRHARKYTSHNKQTCPPSHVMCSVRRSCSTLAARASDTEAEGICCGLLLD